MKVMVILFFLTKIGGVETFHNNIISGLKKENKVINVFVHKNKTNTTAKKIKENYGAHYAIGYETEEMLREYKRLLEREDPDMILFSHPSPTMNKGYTTKKWQEIFKLSGRRCYLVFHEPLDNRKWIGEVKNNIVAIGCVQEKAVVGAKLIKEFDTIPKRIINFPINIEDAYLYDDKKEQFCISPHQFKSWKHIDIQVRAVPYLRYPLYVTNGGIEQCYMAGSLEKRKEAYKENGKWIWDTALESGKMKYLGFLKRTQLSEYFKKAMCLVDMSTGERGTEYVKKKNKPNYDKNDPFLNTYENYRSLNYGIFCECCNYGIVPIMRREWSEINLLKKWSERNSYNTCFWIEEGDLVRKTAKSVNYIIENFGLYKNMRETNLNNLKIDLDCKVIAGNIIKHFNAYL